MAIPVTPNSQTLLTNTWKIKMSYELEVEQQAFRKH